MRGIRTFLVVILALAGCGRGATSLPPELLGTWQTSAPQYSGRYLELRAGSVIFGTGDGAPELHELTGVDAAPGAPGATRYTIHYRGSDGESLTLQFDHSPGPPVTLRLSNRDSDWHKQAATPRTS